MLISASAPSYNLQTSLGQFSKVPAEIRFKIIGYLSKHYKMQPLVALKQTSKGMKEHVDQVVKPNYFREIESCYFSDAWKTHRESKQEVVAFHAGFAEIITQCKNLEKDDSDMIKLARNQKNAPLPAHYARVYLASKLNLKSFISWQELCLDKDAINSPKQNTQFYCLARSILTEMSKNQKHPQQKVAVSILQEFPRESAFDHYDHSIGYLMELLQPITAIDYESFTNGLNALTPKATQNLKIDESDIKVMKEEFLNCFGKRVLRPFSASAFPTLRNLALFVSENVQYLGTAGLQFEQEHR